MTRKPAKQMPPSGVLKALLDYEPGTGLLIWKKRDKKWFLSQAHGKRWNTVFSGKRAGTLKTNPRTGYKWRTISIFDKPYLEHRIVWAWMTEKEPPEQIDHLDRDATNNAWLNLCESDVLKNSHNQSMPKRNTSGVTGVTWHKQHKAWMARCGFKGVMHHIGYFDDIEEAASAVLSFRAKRNFNPDHGMALAPYHRVLADG
ncbi:HNH endonuclease [Vreelandella maris]|uniref:HNH endonuclease n=1 Tax=Vreelandella maris TaxID=2729617 RepID=UPI0030EBF852